MDHKASIPADAGGLFPCPIRALSSPRSLVQIYRYRMIEKRLAHPMTADSDHMLGRKNSKEVTMSKVLQLQKLEEATPSGAVMSSSISYRCTGPRVS